jgi:hypothetical protein
LIGVSRAGQDAAPFSAILESLKMKETGNRVFGFRPIFGQDAQ